MPGVSVVIPCHPPHVGRLAECVRSVSRQTLPPSEIIVALSSTSPESAADLLPQLQQAAGGIPVRLSLVAGAANAAQNRNRGMHAARHPIVSFFDADDIMRRQRLARVVALMEEHAADAALHSFERHGTVDTSPLTGRVWTPEEMAQLNREDRDCIHLTRIHVTHGHVTVRKRVADVVQQDPAAHLCEDSVFVRALFDHNLRVVYTEDVLSNYM